MEKDRKNFIHKNEGFICENCGEEVYPLRNGSCRNHCPICFHSKHVDNVPGDRLSDCKGIMEPIDFEYRTKKGYMIIHKCKKCGKEQKNKMAFEDKVQPDDYDLFLVFIKEINMTK
jgi:hypothetical protein